MIGRMKANFSRTKWVYFKTRGNKEGLLWGNEEGLFFKSSRGLDLHNQVVSAIMIPETSVSDKAHFVLLARIESGC